MAPSTPTELVSFPPLSGQVAVLTGPTASGKTEIAIEAAEQLATIDPGAPPIEIVSLDSMAVYQGMDIGVAKPTRQQRDRIPHHLVDIVQPNQDFSVTEYLRRTHRVVAEIRRRGARPMLVGGTPMYLKAALRGFCPGPPPDEDFRRQVAEDVCRYGLASLRQRLVQVDPLSASKIDPGDERRMTRALEFAFHTGTPISHHQGQFDARPDPKESLVFALDMPRPVLHERIKARIEIMFDSGLPDEVVTLLRKYGQLSRTASQGVGYRELIPWAQAVASSEAGSAASATALDSALEQVLFHTRRLARRQSTWIRSFSEIRSVETHRNRVPLETRKTAAIIAEAIAAA
ncbi:MAG: tRNA (adenosine(37)-N6)-dimethylallyltransferase MiaA [Planctomycetota bacterium]